MVWSHTTRTDLGEMTTRPLTPDLLSDMDLVFGERGVARSCYCMHWRRPDGGFGDNRDNRDRFSDVLDDGRRPPGLLGYVGDAPVGWVQVGPREVFPTLARSRLFKQVDEVDAWSINCFVVRSGHRRKGVGAGLLASAIEYARSEGATAVEAYPVDGERVSTVDYFTGIKGMFDQHGFVEIIRRKDSRPVVRLTL